MVRDWKAAKAKRGGGSRSAGRDFRDPGDDENPFSLDLKTKESSDEDDSDDSDEEESGDESDGFGGTISKKPTKKSAEEEAKEEEELAKSLGSTNLASSSSKPSAPPVPSTSSAGTSSGGRGLGERRVVKTPEEIAQARAAKKVEKKPTTDAPKNLNKGAPVQMSRREREEKEKAEKAARYAALHAAGKTDEAKKDMARLAAIRKQREATKLAKDKEAADKEAARSAALAKSGRKIAK